MLKPISESPYQMALRTNAMTSLTRMNSGKYSTFLKPTTYIPPRPIQMNTADIDVSASKFDKNRNVRMRSTSPEPTKPNEAEQSNSVARNSSDTSAFMPRVDQNDPPHFRSTIKRDRHIVRLSTMRKRSKSRSKSRSIEKRPSSKKSRSSLVSSSSKKSSSDDLPELDTSKDIGVVDDQNVKRSWRDKFGDSLQMNTQKVARKTPGELILEKHIIRDRKNDEKLTQSIPKTIIRLPETVTPQEITYLEPMIRKSIRRQSLIKCPSFKDICNDISSDLKFDDDLNAGDLRRRASLILEQEEQILVQLSTATRRPSADLVSVDIPIPEVDEPGNENIENQLKDGKETQAENVIVIKKKTKKKNGKVRHKITVSVDVENPVAPELGLSLNCGTSLSAKKNSPKWNAVVEEIKEDHTVHKIFKLPKKRESASDSAPQYNKNHLKKSESGEDFWKLIDRRESIHYKKKIEYMHKKIDVLEIVEQDCQTECTPSEDSEQVEIVEQQLEQLKLAVEAKHEDVAVDEKPNVVSKERRRSSFAVKSRSTNDIEEMKELKKKLKSEKPKLNKAKKSEAPTVTSDDKHQAQTKVCRSEMEIRDGDKVATPAKTTSIENNTQSNVSNAKISNKMSDSDSGEKPPSKVSTDELKIVGPTPKGKAQAAIGTSAPKSSPKDRQEGESTSATEELPGTAKNEKHAAAREIVIKPKVKDDLTISPPTDLNAPQSVANGSALPKVIETQATGVETKPKKIKKLVSSPKANIKKKSTASAPISPSSQNENREIVGNALNGTKTVDVKSSITIETVQHDAHDKDAKSIAADDADNTNNNHLKTISASVAVVALSKFATVSNLNSSDLSASVQRLAKSNAIDDDDYISGEETFDLLLSSDPDDNSADDWEQCSDTEPGDEMGLKRRHRKKKDKFDPKKVVKLDHKRKCYVIDEAPKYPLIATPRPLQKKYKFYSESETESEGSDSDCVSSDGCYDECLSPNDVVVKDVIRMSTCSNDSGFEGGGTAPSSPKKMLGKHERACEK